MESVSLSSCARISKKKTKQKKHHAGSDNNDICMECSAICCKDLAVIILRPRTRGEIEELQWHLRFDTVSVFIRNRRWHLLIKGKCIYLADNNRCRIYDKRPDRCRDHSSAECERLGAFYEVLISTPEELLEYLDSGKNGKKPRASRSLSRKRPLG
jgi:Fe-S-cluster containining protein